MWQVRRSGYKVYRLGAGFIIHYPHPESKSKRTLMKRRKLVGRQNVDVERIAKNFRRWLNEQVPDQETLLYCEDYEEDYAPA